MRLLDKLDISTDYLLGREPEREKDKFVEIYSKLPAETKEIFISTIKKLTDF